MQFYYVECVQLWIGSGKCGGNNGEIFCYIICDIEGGE